MQDATGMSLPDHRERPTVIIVRQKHEWKSEVRGQEHSESQRPATGFSRISMSQQMDTYSKITL